MTARLVITEDSYVLQQATDTGWNDLAVLSGGDSALLSATRPLNEACLEIAIEVAENWLMPHARQLRGEILEVSDTTQRLAPGLNDLFAASATSWSVADLEQLYLRLIDLATGKVMNSANEGRQALAADLLMLRELATHGYVREIRLL